MNRSTSLRYVKGLLLRAFFSLLGGLWLPVAYGQQPIQVNVTVMQPVSPYLPQLAADISGGQYNNVEASLSDKLIVQVTNTSQTPQRIKLGVRIERLSPEPAAVYLRPDYQPSAPLILGPQQTIQLDRKLIEDAFGNFSRGKLVFENLSLSALRQNYVNYKLPEGIYRVCVNAYDYDLPGQAAPRSSQNANCAVFNICYTASPPQFTMPVSTLMGAGHDMTTFTPNSQQIQFAWTAPSTTCGLPLGMVNYDLEIREIFPGQTVNDAKNNPFVFRKQQIPSPFFMLDTLLNPHVFQVGKQYTVQVKANLQPQPNSPLEIANQGYSEVAAITYAPTPKFPPIGGGGLPIPEGVNIVATSAPIASGNDCEGVEPPSSSTPTQEDLNGRDVRVGKFTMHVDQATRNGNGYSGTGYITWTPYGKTIKLKVAFTDVGINDHLELMDGVVNTTRDTNIPEWLTLNTPEALNNLVNLQSFVNPVNLAANKLHEIKEGDDPVNFPLGLNDTQLGGGIQGTLAIMSIGFTPEGTDMRMLFSMEIPEVKNWLSLAGTGFCIQPDGFSGEKGILYLPSDRDVNLDGTVFTLKGATATGGTLDTTQTTYLKWNADGFERLFVKADLSLPEDLKAVDGTGKRTGDRVKMRATFDFNEWDNWIANLTTSDDFEIDNLPGFIIHMDEGLYYDHSVLRNPQPGGPIVWPKDQGDKKFIGKDATYQGIYMKQLTMKLPPDFVGIGGTAPDITFTDLFINGENGLWADINAQNLLDIDDGEISGWAFSIDKFTMPIKKWTPQGASMTGQTRLPISNDPLSYNCNLNAGGEKGIAYAFSITPKPNYKIPMWVADMELLSGTTFVIEKEAGSDAKIGATLNGFLGININENPKVILKAIDIQGMQIANYNMKKTKPAEQEIGKFYFNSGSITYASLQNNGVNNAGSAFNTPDLSTMEPEFAYHHGHGPYAPTISPASENSTLMLAGSGGKDNSVVGFGFTPKAFKPVIAFDKGDSHNQLGIGFSFDSIYVDLGLEGVMQVRAKSGFTVWGILGGTATKPKVAGSKPAVTLDRVELDGTLASVVDLSGSVDFRYGDEWGEGVSGNFDVTFTPGITIAANVVFGAKDNFNYYGVGASLYVKNGIVPIGPIIINGFGGGYYHNLAMTAADSTNWDRPLRFVPEEGASAFSVNLALSYMSAEILKANANLLVGTNSHGGISVNLNGWANVISDGQLNSEGIVNAKLEMEYADNEFDMYINANAELFDGAAKVCIPIWAHAGDKGYWLYLGYPAAEDGNDKDEKGRAYERIKVQLFKLGAPGNLLYVDLGADAYFCAGTQLPAFPALPDKLDKFLGELGGKRSASNTKLLGDIAGGAGFMFGAKVHGQVQVNLGIFYVDAEAFVGFDVALKHYPVPPCAVNADDTFGMNNWYAKGQFFAYLGVDVGFKIDVWFYSGQVSLANLAIGAALQAGLPHPTWMDGRIRIKGEVLGGLIRVNTGCQFSVGTKCTEGSDPLANIQMISEIGPAEEDVSPFANPYVVFSVPMSNKKVIPLEFEVPKNNIYGQEIKDPETGLVETYIRTYRFDVMESETTISLRADDNKTKSMAYVKPIDYNYSPDGFTMSMINNGAVFKDNKNYGIFVKCIAKERLGAHWETPKEYKNQNKYPDGFTQDSTVYFVTGESPDIIPEYHVVNSYPMRGQRYYLKNEFQGKGRILLYKDNPKAFQLDDAKTPLYNLTLVPKDGSGRLTTTFMYNPAIRSVDFTLPAGIKNSTVYTAYFSVEDAEANKLIDEAMKAKEITIAARDLQTKAVIMSKQGIQKNIATAAKNKLIKTNSGDGKTDQSVQIKTDLNIRQTGKAALINAIQIYPSNANNIGDLESVTKDWELVEQDTIETKEQKSLIYQPKSGRIIYSMVFATSKYNTFNDKIAALGTLNATYNETQTASYEDFVDDPSKVNYPDLPETKSKSFSYSDARIPAFEGEDFDEYEVKGILRQVRADSTSLPHPYFIPPLVSVSGLVSGSSTIPLGADGKYNNESMYDIAYQLGEPKGGYLSDLTIDFGNHTVRDHFYDAPKYATQLNSSIYTAMLNADGTAPMPPFVSSGKRLEIVDATASNAARDFKLLKLAIQSYGLQFRFKKLYSDLVMYMDDGDSRVGIASTVNLDKFYSTLYTLINAGQFTLNDYVAYYYGSDEYREVDKAREAAGTLQHNYVDILRNSFLAKSGDAFIKDNRFFWSITEDSDMQKLRKMTFVQQAKTISTVNLRYGFGSIERSSTLNRYNAGNYGTTDFKPSSYPLFPAFALEGIPAASKSVQYITPSQMADKEEKAEVNLLEQVMQGTVVITTSAEEMVGKIGSQFNANQPVKKELDVSSATAQGTIKGIPPQTGTEAKNTKSKASPTKDGKNIKSKVWPPIVGGR